MKKPIRDRSDIELLVNTFYQKVQQEPLLGPVFNEVAQVNWELHLPKMYDFWESILLDNPIYKGNPMLTHLVLDQKTPLTPEHFARWKALFFETLDEQFEGTVADEAKKRAESIAGLMEMKVTQNRAK